MLGYVYILKDDLGRFYLGSTSNLSRRLKQHAGKHTHTTIRMKNPAVCFSQKFDTLQEARRIELKLKKLKRKDYIDKIIQDGFIKIR